MDEGAVSLQQVVNRTLPQIPRIGNIDRSTALCESRNVQENVESKSYKALFQTIGGIVVIAGVAVIAAFAYTTLKHVKEEYSKMAADLLLKNIQLEGMLKERNSELGKKLLSQSNDLRATQRSLETLKAKNENLTAGLALRNLEFNALENTCESQINRVICDLAPDGCLRFLPETTPGASYNEKSLGQVLHATPGLTTIAVEIKNHLEVTLSNYTLYLKDGHIFFGAPAFISAKTKEVFTFANVPDGAFLYHVEGTEFAIHVYFFTGFATRWLAIAFLQDFTNLRLWLETRQGDKKTINPTAFSATPGTVINPEEEIILNIREGNLRAKADIKFESEGKCILTLEIWSQ